MTRPHTYLVRMLVFLACVAGAAVFLYGPLAEFFLANGALNGLIVGVLILGVIYNFRQVIRLYPEVAWIDTYRDNLENGGTLRAAPAEQVPPKLLAPMATMVSKRESLSLSALSLRSLLDSIASRLDESRDLSRYTIGLLIFLGLLGTLAPFFDELLPYLGYEPIPPNLMLTGQALLVALIACAMMLKARRGPQRS